jgi:dipeptidase E
VELLLFSSSTVYGRGYLDHGIGAILSFLGTRRRLAFVPFAIADRDGYARRVASRLGVEGIEVTEVPLGRDGSGVVEAAEAVFVGGGNTFRLLKLLGETGLLSTLPGLVRSGLPYMGASAGTNVACPTICTTNDMPIVELPSLGAMGLVPFQINPHYQEPDPLSRHMGETRDERLGEYLEENAGPVVGLKEGSWIRQTDAGIGLEGPTGARLFRRERPPEDLVPGSALDFLLESRRP